VQLGYELEPKELDDVFERFKGLADKKKVRTRRRLGQRAFSARISAFIIRLAM
jgi:isopropylmalate/homocitrate/citramalate synthase